jgi:MoaA/NifB/PqqE/SkfB family radical SAM enzyme
MKIKPLVLLATYNCNFNCDACLFKDRLNSCSINLNLLKKILKQAKILNYNLIAITGGEPCMHPEFSKLIKLIVDNGFYFGIASNGFDWEKYSELIKYGDKFKYITFSLDSHKEKIHDSLRRKGSFKKVIGAINYFTQVKIDISVSICLNKKNYKDINDYIDFIDKLGIYNVRFLGIIPFSWNKTLVLNKDRRRKSISLINSLRNKNKLNLRIMSSLFVPHKENFCLALNLDALTINPKGELIFCCDISQKGAILGDLKKEKFVNLIKKGKKMADYLKNKRKIYIESGVKIKEYDTCYFCNNNLQNNLL